MQRCFTSSLPVIKHVFNMTQKKKTPEHSAENKEFTSAKNNACMSRSQFKTMPVCLSTETNCQATCLFGCAEMVKWLCSEEKNLNTGLTSWFSTMTMLLHTLGVNFYHYQNGTSNLFTLWFLAIYKIEKYSEKTRFVDIQIYMTILLKVIQETKFQECFQQWHHCLVASQGESTLKVTSADNDQVSKLCFHKGILGIKLPCFI